jgi:ethanolamine utilization microcompartment shell protein EutS
MPFSGCRERNTECPGAKKAAAPIGYITVTPSQVNAAIQRDIADAAKRTKGKMVDFSTAVIKGALTFSEVTKRSPPPV